MGPSRCQRGARVGELLGGQRGKQYIDGWKVQLTAQHPWLPPWSISFERHKPCPGFAVLGNQDRFAGMGGVDQSGELGFGLVNIDGAHGGRPA